jgi:hypothetical protein
LAAIEQFRGPGFTIKPGRRHQNGIENGSIKFADGSYLELITSRDASGARSELPLPRADRRNPGAVSDAGERLSVCYERQL